MESKRIWIIVIALLALAASAVVVLNRFRSAAAVPPAAVLETQVVGSILGYEIVREYPHDTDAFTQGLLYLDGFLYESTGITGRSSLRKVRLETGEVLQRRAVNRGDYGEGLTEWRGRLIQLTPRRRGSEPIWHVRKFLEDLRRHFVANVGVTYDVASFEPRSSFMYEGEGWGLTHDDRRLIMSDGSSKLRFLDPETFAELGRLEVFDGNEPVEYLNELEFVDGKIYANVWRQDRIAIIEPDSGQVTGWVDLTGLTSRMPPLSTGPLRPVLNGIAYDAAGRRLFVTGKFWPTVFEIRARSLERSLEVRPAANNDAKLSSENENLCDTLIALQRMVTSVKTPQRRLRSPSTITNFGAPRQRIRCVDRGVAGRPCLAEKRDAAPLSRTILDPCSRAGYKRANGRKP